MRSRFFGILNSVFGAPNMDENNKDGGIMQENNEEKN